MCHLTLVKLIKINRWNTFIDEWETLRLIRSECSLLLFFCCWNFSFHHFSCFCFCSSGYLHFLWPFQNNLSIIVCALFFQTDNSLRSILKKHNLFSCWYFRRLGISVYLIILKYNSIESLRYRRKHLWNTHFSWMLNFYFWI